MTEPSVIASSPGALPPFWDPEADDVLVCREVRDETHDVKTFVFSGAEPRLFAYQPGQFLTFELPIGAETVSRCYTVASTPTRPHLISITVKRTGGPVSGWLHATLRPGLSVKALGPMGEFTCTGSLAAKFLFLSAGSGITPLMSMARARHDLASDADIAFVHSARSPADLIFRRELELMAERPGFRFTPICEADAPGQVWTGLRGRLNLDALRAAVPDFLEREVYLCGPAPYMAAAKTMLEAAGLPASRLFSESFDFGELTAQAPELEAAIEALEGERFAVEFTKSRRTIQVGAGDFVLAAARAEGMRLPSSCTRGMCGTCKSRLVSGTVQMTHAGGIRQREIDQGLILLCCSKPTSDLVVER